MNFVHLNVHTCYSFGSGACEISVLCRKAKEMGQSALAITDTSALYGAVEFFDECKKLGIKPIIGCEVLLAPNGKNERMSASDVPFHLTLLCINKIGYNNLCKIVSEQTEKGISGEYVTDRQSVFAHSAGLIALSGAEGGEIAFCLSQNRTEQAAKTALEYKRVFGENFFIELSAHNIAAQLKMCGALRKIAAETGIRTVATNCVYYVEKSDSMVQRILSCIGQNKRISEENAYALPTEEYYLKSADEMLGIFEESELEITAEIAERCTFEFEFGVTKLPLYTQQGVSDNAAYMRKLISNGAVKRYGDNPVNAAQINERIEYEFDIISRMGFVDYFLIVWDFVHYAKSNGISVGPGRGSGAASICAYCMGITDIDPLRYNLLFERFLNPERTSMPDFDIDFCNERRGEVIEYVRRRYGEDHVAQIAAFDTLKARAAVRDAGRVLGIPLPTVDRAAKLVDSYSSTLAKEIENGELGTLYRTDAEVKRLVDAAMRIEGLPRHTSIHAAGILITREPCVEYVPLRCENGSYTAMYTMTQLERLGLLKMDFLGLKNLAVIDKACAAVRHIDPKFDIGTIPENDSAVFEMLGNGQTAGVFQFESAGMTDMLKRLKPQSVEDLTAAIALYRPGPMASIPKYIENRHKKAEDIQYAHPMLKDILSVTYGCIVYQEQVMQICRVMGGYSYGQADLVRRAMSKKKHDIMEKERSAFVYGNENIRGAVRNGVPENVANAIFDEMAGFASYAFNKAHAAAYATVAYRTAFLRCRYYAEYMSALITAFPEKLADYAQDMKNSGVKILPPDVNRSLAEFSVEDGAIRTGLSCIRNLGQDFAEQIVKEREQGKFSTAADFAVRMAQYDNNKRYMEALIKCGALEGISPNRRALLLGMDELLDYAQREYARKMSGQIDLFEMSGDETKAPVLADTKDYSEIQKLALEKEMTGVYLSCNPAELFSAQLAEDSVFLCDLDSIGIGAQISFVALLTSYRRIVAKNGKPMCFVRFEDATADVEGVMFDNTELREGVVYFVTARISMRAERRNLVVDKVIDAQTLPPKNRRRLFLQFASENDSRIEDAENILSEYKGVCSVGMCFADTRSVKQSGKVNGVRICSRLCDRLVKLLGHGNVIIK